MEDMHKYFTKETVVKCRDQIHEAELNRKIVINNSFIDLSGHEIFNTFSKFEQLENVCFFNFTRIK